jgi:hypothetical protein
MVFQVRGKIDPTLNLGFLKNLPVSGKKPVKVWFAEFSNVLFGF